LTVENKDCLKKKSEGKELRTFNLGVKMSNKSKTKENFRYIY